MAEDWRRALKAAGWNHDEANDCLSSEVWKYGYGRGGEINVTPGGTIMYMAGEVQTLQRVVSLFGEVFNFDGKSPTDRVSWWRHRL